MPYGGLWYNTHYVPWKAINSTGTLVRQYILRNTSSLLKLALIKKVCQCKADLFFSGNLHGLQWGFKILPVLEMVLFSSWDPYSGSETEWDGRAGNHQFHSCLSFLNCFLHYFKLVWILLWEEQNTQQSVWGTQRLGMVVPSCWQPWELVCVCGCNMEYPLSLCPPSLAALPGLEAGAEPFPCFVPWLMLWEEPKCTGRTNLNVSV